MARSEQSDDLPFPPAQSTRACPQAVLDLAGAWPDFPTAEELRAGQPNDSVRQS